MILTLIVWQLKASACISCTEKQDAAHKVISAVSGNSKIWKQKIDDRYTEPLVTWNNLSGLMLSNIRKGAGLRRDVIYDQPDLEIFTFTSGVSAMGSSLFITNTNRGLLLVG